MNILVIGANGQIGKLLVEKIASSTPHTVYGMVRKEAQLTDILDLGGVPILADLEKDFEFTFEYMDAVVFTAGSGGHTGPEKTIAIDQEAAIQAIKLADKHQIKHFIMISTLGASQPSAGPDSLAHYLEAKGKADAVLQDSALDYTIVRPTSLSNDAPTGKIAEAKSFDGGTISRADVAAFVTALLPLASSYKQIYTIKNGDTPIKNYL